MFSNVMMEYAIPVLMIMNNVTVWPPALLGYKCVDNDKESLCPSNVWIEYSIVQVGGDVTEKCNGMCITYSPIGLVWAEPRIYNAKKSIILNGNITNDKLNMWLSIDHDKAITITCQIDNDKAITIT